MPFSRTDLEYIATHSTSAWHNSLIQDAAKGALAEIDRLKAVNAELLKACQQMLLFKDAAESSNAGHASLLRDAHAMARAAIAKAKEPS